MRMFQFSGQPILNPETGSETCIRTHLVLMAAAILEAAPVFAEDLAVAGSRLGLPLHKHLAGCSGRKRLWLTCMTEILQPHTVPASCPGHPATCGSGTPSDAPGRPEGPTSRPASAIPRRRMFRAALASRSGSRPQPPQANSRTWSGMGLRGLENLARGCRLGLSPPARDFSLGRRFLGATRTPFNSPGMALPCRTPATGKS